MINKQIFTELVWRTTILAEKKIDTLEKYLIIQFLNKHIKGDENQRKHFILEFELGRIIDELYYIENKLQRNCQVVHHRKVKLVEEQ